MSSLFKTMMILGWLGWGVWGLGIFLDELWVKGIGWGLFGIGLLGYTLDRRRRST